MGAILNRSKFQDPVTTASGETRASVSLLSLQTLWINTGTLCNLTCANCYIESSPTNDRLVYITKAEVNSFLEEIAVSGLETNEIGFTGGEPFMNPEIIDILEATLSHDFRALVLTNAMRPMTKMQDGLLELRKKYNEKLVLRVSLDHYDHIYHEKERGARTWEPAIEGLRWLSEKGFTLSIAGRTVWDEDEGALRTGYGRLFKEIGLNLNPHNPVDLVLFPEMDEMVDVPEITTDCWSVLGISPEAMMCASSRMVVKKKGSDRPVIVPCTLLPYDDRFEMGHSLADAAVDVPLNHPHCSKFCVLGGGSCSAN